MQASVIIRKKNTGLFALVLVGADARAALLRTGSAVVESASLSSCGRLSAVDTSTGGCNPGKVLVSKNCGAAAVNEDYLQVFALSVLSNPVGV